MKTLYKVTDVALLGLRNLVVHKVRSFLTALGIIFGVWGIVAMLVFNEGTSKQAQETIRRKGTDNLLIRSVKPPQEQAGAAQERGALEYGLKHADVRKLGPGGLPGVKRIVTAHGTIKDIPCRGKTIRVQVFGTYPIYQQLGRLRLVAGRFLSDTDLATARNTCVITRWLGRRLFRAEDPIDKTIRLGGEIFRVVGIADQVGTAIATVPGEVVTKVVFIPMDTDKKRFGKYTILRSRSDRMMELVEVSLIIIQFTDEKAVVQGARIARSLLSREHGKGDYEIEVPLEEIEQLRQQRWLGNIMFFAIASISLVVGGIGIMNIMLASVTERTREIGIRRALGATRADIVTQFLVEAVTLTFVGGLVGIALGLPVPWLMKEQLGIPGELAPSMLVIPFLMAVIVGLVSGLYPATRAARLDPIVALRHE